MTIQVDDNGQPLVAALQFPVYRLSEFDWKNWTPASRFYYTQFIGIDDTATPVVYSLRYCIPGVAGGVGQVSSNTLEDFQAEIANVLARQDRIDIDVADLLAQVNSLLTTAQDVAAQAQSSVTSSAQSATSASDFATKAQTWAEGEDTAVTALGGTHSSKVWANEAETHATAAHNDYISMTTDANVVAVGSNISSVNTVATNMSDISTAVTNLAAIQDAPNQAASANNSKIEAQNSANTAQTMAMQAGQSATEAAQSAQTAQTEATQAAQSAQTAGDKADEASESARVAVAALSMQIGDVMFAPLGIDESLNLRRYLNGQVLIQSQFVSFTNKVKSAIALYPNLATTETNWQAEKTNSKLGQCGKFVVDDTAGTIRLPCVVNVQGLVDLALIGGIKSESLPNITGEAGYASDYGFLLSNATRISGAFKKGQATTAAPDGNTKSSFALAFDASGSSSTYQNNAPVQQEAVQYPYCIVVNTGVEESERPINNYQVNNVYSYGMSQYYKGTMNNNSWLKSAGQWNDGTVYTGMYNWLLEQMNAGVSGFVASTATYTDYDFVINTADQTFRLPLKNGQEGIFADGVKGNGMAIGLTDGTNSFGLGALSSRPGYLGALPSFYGENAGTSSAGAWGSQGPALASGLSQDPSKSGIIVDKTVPSGWNLYYYIGDTLQNAQLINVARIEETLVDKADTDLSNCTKPYVTETYRNGTEWYRLWSDGWIEQGGWTGSATVNLLKSFSDTTYTVQSTCLDSGTTNFYASFIQSKSTNSFVAFIPRGSLMWRACGY